MFQKTLVWTRKWPLFLQRVWPTCYSVYSFYCHTENQYFKIHKSEVKLSFVSEWLFLFAISATSGVTLLIIFRNFDFYHQTFILFMFSLIISYGFSFFLSGKNLSLTTLRRTIVSLWRAFKKSLMLSGLTYMKKGPNCCLCFRNFKAIIAR